MYNVMYIANIHQYDWYAYVYIYIYIYAYLASSSRAVLRGVFKL